MGRAVFKGLSLIVVVVLSCCSEQRMSPLPPDAKVVAFGDSLTYGVGANQSQSYPKVLAELTGLTVVNAGISGETTSQGLARLQSVLDSHSPELVILLEGGNDILRSHEASLIKQNLDHMISMAKSAGAQILLIGVPEKKLFSDSADWYSELASEHHLVFDGETLSNLLRTPKFKSDPIHLNAPGYRKFAESIHQLLIEHGALSQ